MAVLTQESWRPVELYGGAIAAQFPKRYVDVSDFRPVPDHQEVGGEQVQQRVRQPEQGCFTTAGAAAAATSAVQCFSNTLYYLQVWADGATDQSIVVEIAVSASVDKPTKQNQQPLCSLPAVDCCAAMLCCNRMQRKHHMSVYACDVQSLVKPHLLCKSLSAGCVLSMHTPAVPASSASCPHHPNSTAPHLCICGVRSTVMFRTATWVALCLKTWQLPTKQAAAASRMSSN
jgi:hypothetical protein